MKVTLKRIARKPNYTIGRLFLNDERFCDTCEDCDRGLEMTMPLDMIKKIKVPGQTAIPTGTYELSMRHISPTYAKKKAYAWTGGIMPRILGVPGFDGILMHPGNSADDSRGCILPGENKAVGKVLNSMAIFKKLWHILYDHRNEPMYITVC